MDYSVIVTEKRKGEEEREQTKAVLKSVNQT